jgi:hypothetical protein
MKPPEEDTSALMGRLKAVLAHTDLDCGCQDKVRNAIDRFASLEQRRATRRRVTAARDHKERIAAILALLQELDQVTEKEPDRTVFLEMAMLFEDVAASAAAAAAGLRKVTELRRVEAPSQAGD